MPATPAGVFTLTEAIAAGWSTSAISRNVAAGRWQRLQRGVYLAGAGLPTPWQIARAIQLSTAGVPSHVTAARTHGLWSIERGDWVTVAAATHRAPRHGLRIHREDLAVDAVQNVDGLLVTTPQQTLVDLARRSSALQAVCAIESAVRLGRLLTSQLEALRAHPDDRVARRAQAADLRSESPLETAVRLILLAAGVPVVSQWPVAGRFRLDLAIPSIQIGIECDGATVHSGPQALYADRHRSNQLVQTGWVLLRFTWWDVHRRPGWIVETVSAAVASRQIGSGRG